MREGTADPSRDRVAEGVAEENARAREITNRLAGEFVHVEPQHIERLVINGFGAFSGAPVRDFVGVFVERGVRGALRRDDVPRRADAGASGTPSSDSATS